MPRNVQKKRDARNEWQRTHSDWHNKRQREWRHKNRAEAIKAAGGKCWFCGSTRELEFHHWDAATKLEHRIWSWSQKRREAELEKMVLVCHKHHLEIHESEGSTTGTWSK